MPIIHVQLTGQGLTPDGQTVPVPPSQVMQNLGPLVQVTVGPAQSLVNQWTQTGIPVPAPISGNALIDTGASNTCIDEDLAQRLGLPVIDLVHMVSASDSSQRNVYPAQITLLGSLTVNVDRALSAALAQQNIIALIGRDVLQMCTLFYNGLSGEFTLSI